MLRFGIIGVAAASGEARAISAHPDCTIASVADRSEGNIAEFTAKYPSDAYTDVARMCATSNVDAVFIGTPTQFHYEHASSGSTAGAKATWWSDVVFPSPGRPACDAQRRLFSSHTPSTKPGSTERPGSQLVRARDLE